MKNSIIRFYILFLVFTTFFDPQNGLGFRTLLLASSLPVFIQSLIKLRHFRSTELALRSFLLLALPLYGILIWLLRGDVGGVFNDTSYISFAIIFGNIYIFDKSYGEYILKKFIQQIGLLFSISILITAIITMSGIDNSIIQFLIDRNIARIGFRDYGEISLPYIYYYSSTLLIVPILLGIERLNTHRSFLTFFLILINVLGLLLSGTRSHILIGLILFWFLIKSLNDSKRFFKVIFYSISSIIFIQSILQLVQTFFTLEEENNLYKINIFNQYATILSDPITIFFGEGFQSINWSKETQKIVVNGATKSELTLLELVRVFGLPLTLLFIGILILNIMKINNDNKSKLYGVILLLIDSLLNPHLFSTYGAVICAYAFSKNKRVHA